MALRHTVSPQLSNRPSPPVTRSISRSGTRPLFEHTSTPLIRRSLQPGMHFDSIERVFESADDTDHDLNSSKFVYKEHFTVTEMTSMKKEMWYDWLVYHIRMIRRHLIPEFKTVREMFVVLILVAMLSKYARDCLLDEAQKKPEQFPQRDSGAEWTTEVHRIDQAMSNIRTIINDLGQRTDKLEQTVDQFNNRLNEDRGWKESVVDELESIRKCQVNTDRILESLRSDFEEGKTANVIVTEKDKKYVEPASSFPSGIQVHPSRLARRSYHGVNVANSLIGASIDNSCSSRPASAKDGIFYDLMSYFGTFKEGYVLLDREVLSPGEAWCTYDNRPTLTVKLARFITPTAVSYQHVRWNGIVPNHAPKLYDLVACFDPCCIHSETLVSNCEYKASEDGHDEQEQLCLIPAIPTLPPISHVQFRFRENHGNMTKTCAYLVRVYGDPIDPPKEQVPDNGTSSHLESTIVDSMSDSI